MENQHLPKTEKPTAYENSVDIENHEHFKSRSDKLRFHISKEPGEVSNMELYEQYEEDVIAFSERVKEKYPVPDGVNDYTEGYSSYRFYNGLIMSTPPAGAKNFDFPDDEFWVATFVEQMYAKYWPEHENESVLTNSSK